MRRDGKTSGAQCGMRLIDGRGGGSSWYQVQQPVGGHKRGGECWRGSDQREIRGCLGMIGGDQADQVTVLIHKRAQPQLQRVELPQAWRLRVPADACCSG